MPMEIPLPPPVGFQIVRDPSTGQLLFLPAATTIGKAETLIVVTIDNYGHRICGCWTLFWWPGIPKFII